MAKHFSTLLQKMHPERRERIRSRAEVLLLEMALQDLRRSRNLTQQELAKNLGVSQAALSKMERQEDMRISTLRRILGAMRGNLKLIAEFPDGEVVIGQFGDTEGESLAEPQLGISSTAPGPDSISRRGQDDHNKAPLTPPSSLENSKEAGELASDRREILQWFLDAPGDPEKRKFIFGGASQKKLVELGDVWDWVKWLHDECTEAENAAKEGKPGQRAHHTQ